MTRALAVALVTWASLIAWTAALQGHFMALVMQSGSLLLTYTLAGLATLAITLIACLGSALIWRGTAGWSLSPALISPTVLARTLALLLVTIGSYLGIISLGVTITRVSSQLVSTTDDLRPGEFTWSEESRLLRYSGLIGTTFADRLVAHLDRHPTVQALVISSEGGVVDVASISSAVLADRNIAVGVDESCLSACALLFARTPRRAVSGDAKIGFHAPYFVDTFGLFRYAPDSTAYRRAFLSAGFPETFVAQAVGTAADEMREISGADLITAGVAGTMADAYDARARLAIILNRIGGKYSNYPALANRFQPSGSLAQEIMNGWVMRDKADPVQEALVTVDRLDNAGIFAAESEDVAMASADFAEMWLRHTFGILFQRPIGEESPDPFGVLTKYLKARASFIVDALDYANETQLQAMYEYFAGISVPESFGFCQHVVLGGAYREYVQEVSNGYNLSAHNNSSDSWAGILAYAVAFGHGYNLAADAQRKGQLAPWARSNATNRLTHARNAVAKTARLSRCVDSIKGSILYTEPELLYLYLRSFFDVLPAKNGTVAAG